MTLSNIAPELHQPLSAFTASPEKARAVPLGAGNINSTWLVADGVRQFVLQRLNSTVFPSPRHLIDNFFKVTDHIGARSGSSGLGLVCPRLVETQQGEAGFQDRDGEWWRAQTYIRQGKTEQRKLSGKGAERLGEVLASFHLLTSDLDPASLHTPLPDFHVTPVYLEKYEKIRKLSTLRETEGLRECFSCIERLSECAPVLEEALAKGHLATRIIHGDPKLDNIIMTEDGFASGLFDLDTTGPGLIHYDLGDCLRSVCNGAGENCASLEMVHFDRDICRSVLTGYLQTAGNSLSDWDRHYIYDAILTITFELGLRFITDFLMGNVYFKVSSEVENLQRGRVQLALASSLVKHQEVIREMSLLL